MDIRCENILRANSNQTDFRIIDFEDISLPSKADMARMYHRIHYAQNASVVDCLSGGDPA